jgi:hypothetical protein
VVAGAPAGLYGWLGGGRLAVPIDGLGGVEAARQCFRTRRRQDRRRAGAGVGSGGRAAGWKGDENRGVISAVGC